jgi:hypothetical protein
MGPDLRRRSFLATLGAAGLAWMGWPRAAAAAPRLSGEPARAPGDVVELHWPAGLPLRGARWVHRLDGRRAGASVLPVPRGGVVRLAAVPSDGRLLPGEHRFTLEVGGRTLDGGGFRVAPFRFGC